MNKKITSGVKALMSPIERFLHMEASGGILLIIATLVAMIWVNSGYEESYFHLWETNFSIGYGDWSLSKPLHIWVNDLLMAVFFFFVGLEIKREVLAGELASFKEAAMPIAAALGGMILPASLYVVLIATYKVGTSGWGIPMATDIAFSIGILTLLGKRVPISLKVFLTALAIVDDIGAVLVIALFYSADIQLSYLYWSIPLYALLLLFNYTDVRQVPLYVIVGLIMWYFFLKSGIHPTVCGVLVAFTIPAKRKINLKQFMETAKGGMDKLLKSDVKEESEVVLVRNQIDAVATIEEASDKVQSPLQRLENSLHDWVIHFIMPVFALANAAVVFEGDILATLLSPVAVVLAISLVIGKVVGITFFSWLSSKLGIASLPMGTNWKQIMGVGLLAGIGFTMSLFITNLAFDSPELISQAKVGIFSGSLIAGLAGYFFLNASLKKV